MNNNTTTSDNSSDSTSNNKKSTKTEIEIIDQKIIKCVNEINSLKTKIEKEWSKQMNTHLMNFYDDTNNEAEGGNKSTNNDSITSNASNSFSTPQQKNSSEYERRIFMIQKKLKGYEKKRHKLLYESKKEQENLNPTNQADNLTELKSDSSGSSNALNNLANNNVPVIQITNTTGNLPNQSLQLKLSQRSDSFLINNPGQYIKSPNEDLSQVKSNILQNEEKNPSFYLSPETNLSSLKFSTSTNNNIDLGNYPTNEDHSSNQICMAILQQIVELKLNQEKLQSDLEEIKAKNNENYQAIMKELQNTSGQISDHLNKTMFSYYKSNDQKIEEIKSSFERSIQTFNYNLTHCHRDVKEAKEDISYMKNKIEIIDKTQKIPNIETTPTNYYQLFYKLLDILLTLATIILLAFTNMIASIKFIFLLYPRIIVLILIVYFVLSYIIDYDRLHIDDLSHLHRSKSNSTNSFDRALNLIYGLVFYIKNRVYPEHNGSS